MKYALHEVLEVHEIAAFKTTCLTKSKTMNKDFIQKDIDLSTRQLQEYATILSNAKGVI